MSDIPENPPAFPRPAFTSEQNPGDPFPHIEQDGMTLRDYFAAHAPITFENAKATFGNHFDPTYSQIFHTLAQMRLHYADAMLKARKP